MALLREEDAAPLYSQEKDLETPDGEGMREAWERRGRLKQAVCFALPAIAAAGPGALEFLHRYATDQKEDYTVRASAARALGLLRHPSSCVALANATNDSEWCTQTEARKALEICKTPPPIPRNA